MCISDIPPIAFIQVKYMSSNGQWDKNWLRSTSSLDCTFPAYFGKGLNRTRYFPESDSHFCLKNTRK